MAEAMACGVPVAAYPVSGPVDVVAHGRSGILDVDLTSACLRALQLDRQEVRQHAVGFSWEAATQQFQHHLHQIHSLNAPSKSLLSGRPTPVSGLWTQKSLAQRGFLITPAAGVHQWMIISRISTKLLSQPLVRRRYKSGC